MAHARLVDNNHTASWPEFLNKLQSVRNKQLLGEEAEPVVINMNTSNSEARLKKLVEEKIITKVIDNYGEQLAELLISRDPHLYKANEEVQKHSIAALIKKHYNTQEPWRLGSWVYFGWSGKLVHLIDEESFLELRSIRNRDLIMEREQKILKNFNVGCLGMSVGSNGALAMVLSGISHKLKLADGAVISGSNLNRILAGVDSVGLEKSLVISRKLYEMNPYASIHTLAGKLDSSNVADFLDSPWPLNLVVDEVDDLEMKIRIRVEARKRQIPVIMATELADTIMLDVERFDMEPNRPLFHGLVKNIEQLLDEKPKSQREWMKHATSIIGTRNVPLLMQQSLLKIGSKIVTHPQLGSTAMAVGGVLAFSAKQIALGNELPSQRKSLSFEKTFLPEHRRLKHVRKHQKHTRILKKSIGSM